MVVTSGHTVVVLLEDGHSVGGGRRQPQLPPPWLHVCWSPLLFSHQGNTKDPLAVVHRNYLNAPTFSASLVIPALQQYFQYFFHPWFEFSWKVRETRSNQNKLLGARPKQSRDLQRSRESGSSAVVPVHNWRLSGNRQTTVKQPLKQTNIYNATSSWFWPQCVIHRS